MKIEVFLCEDIHEKCTGSTCFEASEHIRKTISTEKSFKGIILIDNTSVKFSFSPLGMDGDIFTDKTEHRLLVKYLLPIYVYNKLNSITF